MKHSGKVATARTPAAVACAHGGGFEVNRDAKAIHSPGGTIVLCEVT